MVFCRWVDRKTGGNHVDPNASMAVGGRDPIMVSLAFCDLIAFEPEIRIFVGRVSAVIGPHSSLLSTILLIS